MIKLFNGDSFDLIKRVKSDSIKLVMTDVPYPDMTIHDGSKDIIKNKEWEKWFRPLAKDIYRVLEDQGSFVTTINCKSDFSFYHNWVCEMEKLGFKYVYDWFWVKKNIIPGKMSKPRNAMDYIAHFVKGDIPKDIYNMKAIEDWRKFNPAMKIPTNMIVTTNTDDRWYYEILKENGLEKHNGRYPSLIPELFIKLLTKEGDRILEPFNGSGTTSIIAENLNRDCIGFEINENWVALAKTQYDHFNLSYKIIGGK